MNRTHASSLMICLALIVALAGCATRRSTSTPSAPHSHVGEAFHRPAGTGPAYFGPGDLYTFLATGEETGHAYFQFEALVPPGGGPPAHIHHGEDETFYLAEGSLEIQLGDSITIVNKGDFVNVPRGTVHGFKNVGKGPAKLLVTVVPAGLERYFEAVFPVAIDRGATPPPVTDALIEKMNAEAPKHGLEFIPPASSPKR